MASSAISCLIALQLLLIASSWGISLPCQIKHFGESSYACLCTEDYCDSLDPLGEIPENKFYQIVSSRGGDRFYETFHDIQTEIKGEPDVIVTVNRTVKYQEIIGFGGSFTDAATLNIASLSEKLQDIVLEAYYGKSGLEYNIGRVNMASCDFSSRLYSYDDVANDTRLESFALAVEDTDYKIPYIKKAMALNPNLKMFASPWTAPKWMKTNDEYYGKGSLKLEYYDTWANYFVRFLDEYKKLGVTFWAVTAQNEPLDGLLPDFYFNCMGWTAEQQRDFIKNNLGPAIAASEHNDTKIIILDDQRALIVTWSNTVLSDPEAAKYVSGIGVHWYMNFFPPGLLATAHRNHPEVFILATEACAGANPLERPVVLGSWERAERYAFDIIEDLNYFVAGWTDWNLVLDMQGGPNWANNTVDAPIIADSANNLFYKQPMYYALGHFSKFIPEQSVRIDATFEKIPKVDLLVVQRPDDHVAVVILNQNENQVLIAIQDGEKVVEVNVSARSLHTLVYKP